MEENEDTKTEESKLEEAPSSEENKLEEENKTEEENAADSETKTEDEEVKAEDGTAEKGGEEAKEPESSVVGSSDVEAESSSSYIQEEVLTGSSTNFDEVLVSSSSNFEEEVVLEGSSADTLILDGSAVNDPETNTENADDADGKAAGTEDQEELIEEEVLVDDEGNEIIEEEFEEEEVVEDKEEGEGDQEEGENFDSSDDEDLPFMDSDDEREAAAKAAELAAAANGSGSIAPSDKSDVENVPDTYETLAPVTSPLAASSSPTTNEWQKSFDTAPTTQNLNFRDIENQKVPYAPINAGSGTMERSVPPKTSSRVCLLFAITCCLLIAGGGVAIGLIILLELDEDSSDDTPKAAPTPAPTMRPPTPGNEVVTSMSPILGDCNFFGVTQPHVVDQCACDGEIAIVVDDVRARYDFLRRTFIPNVRTKYCASDAL